LISFAVACGSASEPSPQTTTTTPTPPAAPRVDPATDPSPPVPVEPPADPVPPPAAAPGADFIAEARALYRVAGCAEGPLPEAFARDPRYVKVIDRHCQAIARDVAKFREAYFVKGRAWVDQHVPGDVPRSVVYPFGGGDLLSALAVYPSATEITTISLEQSGDPRRLARLTPTELDRDLATFRKQVAWLIAFGSNTSVNLSAQQRTALPGQVTSFLLGLAIGGYEPVAMRYFRIDDTGAIHYLDQAEIEADTAATASLSTRWDKPSFAASFRNVEITYRKLGESGPRVHRHVAWNLANAELAKQPGLLRHLEAKGKVSVIVKGASYLLWIDDFSTMRRYLLDHLAFMLSDSTGIPPMYAEPAGMVLEPWGRYVKPGLPHAVGKKQDLDMRALWKKSKGPAPFRFGYIDSDKNHHLLITRPR
jgi:hypothetical protein